MVAARNLPSFAYFSPTYETVAAASAAARLDTGAEAPQTTLNPESVEVPQTTEDPDSTLSPFDKLETTDVPQTTELPHTTDVPHTTAELVTTKTLPLESLATAGDLAEPMVDEATSVLERAA
jgi:hypothetical protein